MPEMKKNPTRVSGGRHVLFKETITTLPNIGNLSANKVDEYSLHLSQFDEDQTILSKLAYELTYVTPKDKIKIFINSPGGKTDEGKTIINSVCNTGAKITTVIPSKAYSMGSLLFCAGHKRIVYETSTLMFHNWAGVFGGKGREIKERLDFVSADLETFVRDYIIGLSKKELTRMYKGKTFWFNAIDMCQRGIATHVEIDGYQIPAKKYLKMLADLKKKYPKIKGATTIKNHGSYGLTLIDNYMRDINDRRDKAKQKISKLCRALEDDYESIPIR